MRDAPDTAISVLFGGLRDALELGLGTGKWFWNWKLALELGAAPNSARSTPGRQGQLYLGALLLPAAAAARPPPPPSRHLRSWY